MRVASRMRPETRRAITAPTYGPEVITDFSAGTNAAVVDATTLNASTFGVSGSYWSVTSAATHLTYATGAKTPFGGTIPTQSVNPWPGDTGTLGVNLYVPDNVVRFARFTVPGTVAAVITAGIWFKTDYLSTATPNLDIFLIQGAAENNYVNVPFQGNGATLRLASEFASVVTGDITGTPVAISRDTWYWITLRYSSGPGVSHAVRVYDSTLTQVGNEQSATPARAGAASYVSFGFAGAPGTNYDRNVMFSGLLMSYERDCRWPLLPL